MEQKQLVTGIAVAVSVAMVYGLIVSPLFATLKTASGLESGLSQNTNKPLQQLVVDVSTVEFPTTFEVNDIVRGSGSMAQTGDTVFIHYVAMLSDGTVFDTSTDSPEPFSFLVGAEEVIQGLEMGIKGMREGGTRRIHIPPQLGYGPLSIEGPDGDIIVPADSSLIFDVVLVGIEKIE